MVALVIAFRCYLFKLIDWLSYSQMKRLFEEHKKYLLRHARMSHLRSLREKRLRKLARTYRNLPNSSAAGAPSSTGLLEDIPRQLTIPRTLSFEDNRDETCKFFSDLRYAASDKRIRLRIDFTKLREIGPAAALVLAAELETWRLVNNKRIRVVDIRHWNVGIRLLLHDLGLFSLVKVSNPPNITSVDNPHLQFIQFRSHVGVHPDEIGSLKNELERLIGGRISSSNSYRDQLY
ncbi:MAG: hypothetical protein OXH14_17030, partial [Alphaproteobacteria bacterium]|nr:hypothetical protein [Alphaproteobacteria bacterium]